ncbi:hypothetical protein [Mesorhizobium australicum]|uniref:hypothetical protein n=1 Tax=Mesorhizobium australicum TaxID=536018 RepID=UPI00333B9BDE
MNGITLLYASLVRELDDKKLVNKHKLADDLDAVVKAPRPPPEFPRYDLELLANAAKLLRGPTPPGPSWTPYVIQGDQSDEEEPDSSDPLQPKS